MVVRFREAQNLFDRSSLFFTATKNGRMPTVRGDQKLVRIRFRTCVDAQLVIFVCHVNRGGHDKTTGIPHDAWYVIRSPGIPDRLIRIFSGAEGLHDMLLRYAFQDSEGCKHEKHMQLEYARDYQLDENVVSRVIPKNLTDALGIPQFYKQSGNCWFASMCWVLFGNEDIRNFVCDCLQRAGEQDLARWAQRAFHEPDTAQMIRTKLWRDHRIGDDVDAAPHLDGQNGGSEMIRVCDAYNIPLRILQCEAGTRIRELRSVQPGKKHIMLVRAQDKNHTTEMPLRRYYGDKAGSTASSPACSDNGNVDTNRASQTCARTAGRSPTPTHTKCSNRLPKAGDAYRTCRLCTSICKNRNPATSPMSSSTWCS